MALELQSQAIGALQSVAGVALSLRSYKEQKSRTALSEKHESQRDEMHQKTIEHMEAKIEKERASIDILGDKASELRASARRQNAIARERNFNLRQQKEALKKSQSSEDAAAVAEAALSDRTTAINMAAPSTDSDTPWKRRIVSDAVYKGE